MQGSIPSAKTATSSGVLIFVFIIIAGRRAFNLSAQVFAISYIFVLFHPSTVTAPSKYLFITDGISVEVIDFTSLFQPVMLFSDCLERHSV